MRRTCTWSTRADDPFGPCDRLDPRAAGSADRPVFRALERPPCLLRGRGQPAGRAEREGRRRHRRQAPAVSGGDARRHRHRFCGRGQPAARRVTQDRAGAGCPDARRASGHRNEAGLAAGQHRARCPRPGRLAAAGARDRNPVDRPAEHRERPGDADRRRERLNDGARPGAVHRRGALAGRSDPRRGRVHVARLALSLRGFRGPQRAGGLAAALQPEDRRAAGDLRGRGHAGLRPHRAALRRDADAGAARRFGSGDRPGDRPRAVAPEQQGEGHHRGGHAGRGVVPVRPGGPRRDARRRGGVHVRPASAIAGNAVGAAGGSRPAAGRTRRREAAAAFGRAGVRRFARARLLCRHRRSTR